MMWTWMRRRRRERSSWERPRQALGGRTVEIMATVTSREEEEAAWWTAAVGPRSSRISLHHRQKTLTAKGEPDCPASLWVHCLSLLCVQAAQALNSSIWVPTSSFKLKEYAGEIQVHTNITLIKRWWHRTSCSGWEAKISQRYVPGFKSEGKRRKSEKKVLIWHWALTLNKTTCFMIC